MQSGTIALILVKTFIGSFSLIFSVTKQERSKNKSQIYWVSDQIKHTHKGERERSERRERGVRLRLGSPIRQAKRDTAMAATKTGCLDVIKKKNHKEAIRVATPNKTDPFQLYPKLPHS
ncbi:hypothetical protein ACB092_01G370600 [Castanea dentata]